MILSSPSALLHARSIPAPLAGLRQAGAGGTVLAVFERSAYIDLDGRIVAVASADLDRGPLSITLRESGPLHAIESGTTVSLADGELHIGDVVVDLTGAAVWDPTLPPAPSSMTGVVLAAREVAAAEILTSAPEKSIALLLSTTPPTGPLLQPLSRGLSAIDALLAGREDPITVLPLIAHDIAGRGPGLTPSGDDLLVGIVLALWLWPGIAAPRDGGAQTVRDMLVHAARPRTTRVSGAYLEAARQGQAAEPWHVLVRSLHRSPAETRRAVRRLLRIGETSGADTLTGFCWAWHRVPG